MTLVVGIRCTDGVIIGTDSAVTSATGQALTIMQPSKKITIVGDHIILAGTGELGLGQRFADILQKGWKDKAFQDKSMIDIGRLLSQSALNDFAATGAQTGLYGALVAVSCADKAELIEFSPTTFQPELKTDDYWYVSMGSGQSVADPLLGFVRATFWQDDPPRRQDGVFAATMVLKLACDMAPFGVAAPIQMAELSRDKKGKLKARELAKEELSEHEENVGAAIEHFSKYRDILQDNDTSAKAFPKAPST